MEIEKKFLLGERPSILSTIIGVPVKQGYLVTEDGELRIRQKGEKYFMTVKGDGTLSREEWEVEIPEWVFSTLWQKTTGKQIEKIRFAIDFQGLILEIDEYFGNLAGLFTMECEFESVEDAEAFRLPQWAATAVDVTANKAFKNKVLAVKGRPQ
jgi:CYTH domain-containing protein